MEEILASIRRIIADDQDDGRGDAHDDADLADEPVLNRAEPQIFSSDPTPAFPEPQSLPPEPENAPEPVERRPYRVEIPSPPDLKSIRAEIAPEKAPERAPAPEPQRELLASPASDNSLLSEIASRSISQAFNKLGSPAPTTSTARTIDDIVREMLRPMLKAWLDENLPPIVERLVRDEIERVTRARR